MRILYIHQCFATRRGRTGTRSLAQAQHLQADGHEVTMLTSSAQLMDDEAPAGDGVVRRGKVAGVDCIVLDIPYNQQMSYAQRLWSFVSFMLHACRIALTEPGVDLVFATSTPLTVGVPALLAKLVRSTPYVFEVRDLWPDIPAALGVIRKKWMLRPLEIAERTFYRHARLIVAVNDDVAAAIRRKIGGRRPTVVVPNACDTDLFRPGRDGGDFRRAHGLEGRTLCVHTGAMGPVNGLDDILDVSKRFGARDDVRFVLVGGGSRKDRLRARVADERLDNVLILDSIPKSELADVLATADVGLMTVAQIPILELNCANKFFDYLASGLPIILNYGGWQARLLDAHECGLSSPQGDLEGFAGNIERLVADEGLRDRMGRNARKLAETSLQRSAVVRPMLDAIGEISP